VVVVVVVVVVAVAGAGAAAAVMIVFYSRNKSNYRTHRKENRQTSVKIKCVPITRRKCLNV
jgi:hypothetical protein